MLRVAVACLLVFSTFLGCKSGSGTGVNFFSIEDDMKLGAQLDSTILADPAQYPVLHEGQYSAAYSYIRKIYNKVLNSGQVQYRNEFNWTIRIIHDDKTLNAFATPGGYIYVYTGLIKFLETEHQLAGVIGHEIAHADRRHSTTQLTKVYGLQILLAVVFGENPGIIPQIAAGLASLSFSRKAEAEADEYSVRYMCPTDYIADGAADFFEKMLKEQEGGGVPEFLSTHPNPGDRVTDIRKRKRDMLCKGNELYKNQYQSFIRTLPK